MASPSFSGTQAAADRALATLDLRGYAERRNEVLPRERRGATRLSPHLRHGLLNLPQVDRHVERGSGAALGSSADRRKFRDELLWQEYARHLYARDGAALRNSWRFEPAHDSSDASPIDISRAMRAEHLACLTTMADELEFEGWLPNQARMWFAAQWGVRWQRRWHDGEDWFFTHLLDGSRAANRLGWQWTVGTATGRPYAFTRQQVERRAPGCCGTCQHRDMCPIESVPATATSTEWLGPRRTPPAPIDADIAAGPASVQQNGSPQMVWLTAESLGDTDPALAAWPDLPVVFVFDEPLLQRLGLSSKRLVFIAQRLAELATTRLVEVHLGPPDQVLAGTPLATTYTPVPGGIRRRDRLEIAALHPWPWLRRPRGERLTSFSAWRGRSRH